MKTVISDKRCDSLLDEIDIIAREFDQYEFGLPMRINTPAKKMRSAVRKWARSLRKDLKKSLKNSTESSLYDI